MERARRLDSRNKHGYHRVRKGLGVLHVVESTYVSVRDRCSTYGYVMTRKSVVVWCLIALFLVVSTIIFKGFSAGRGQGVIEALSPFTKLSDPRAVVVSTLVKDYQEDRSNAAVWSLVYWGCVFFAAAFSALAALILKFESLFHDEKIKKDFSCGFRDSRDPIGCRAI
jgi:hypothetical protein